MAAFAGSVIAVGAMAGPSDGGELPPARGTLSDYRRAALFQNVDLLVDRLSLRPRWIAQGDTFWYVDHYRGEKRFLRVAAVSGVQEPAFDHDRLAKELSRVLGRREKAGALPFDEIFFRDGEKAIAITVDKAGWTCSLLTYICSSAPPPKLDGEVLSPDEHWAVFVRDHNLWVRDTITGVAAALSTDGIADDGYDANDFGDELSGSLLGKPLAPRVVFSPDSSRLIALRTDVRQVRQLPVLQNVPASAPILHLYHFPLVGDPNLPMATAMVFDLAAHRALPVDAPPFVRMAYDGRIGWGDTGDSAYFTQDERGYKVVRLHIIDVKSGHVTAPVVETTATSTDRAEVAALCDGGREVIWASERDGWKHLYRFDGTTGALINQLTKGEFVVSDIVRADAKTGFIYFTAGRPAGAGDPYYRRLYRERLDGSALQLLTPENGDHTIAMSPTGRYFVDTWSRLDAPPISLLRSADGSLVRELQHADVSRLTAIGWRPPEPFEATAADGATPLFGAIFRPTNFDPHRKYPVIDGVYPGPQAIHTPKAFAFHWLENDQALAELGFIVVNVDGMGTPGRSRAFREVSYGNMGVAGGLADHVAVIRQLAQRYPGFDLDRVGIYGHSGGGFASTRALLLYPDFFKVAVSSSGNHDQRSYSAAWGERYQGYPVDQEAYAAQANEALAKNLKGKLLLATGGMDDNVNPNNTMEMADALIAANKTFDLLVMPNRNHVMVDVSKGANAALYFDPYFIRRRWDYFVENLMGVKPPENFELVHMTSLPSGPDPK